MPRPLSLSPRLLAVSELILPGSRVVDVGTDHARLPVFLLEHGLASSVIAADIRTGPLAGAEKTIGKHRLEGKIELRLCDGLLGISKEEVDTVVIAGMGADTIIEIIRKSPWCLGKNTILQPMTKRDRLLDFLKDYEIDEITAREGKREYWIYGIRRKL